MRASADSPRMFESNFLDFFSRVPGWMVPLIFLPPVTLAFWQGLARGAGPLQSVGLFAVFYVAWTLTEYWLHRMFFHWVPATTWGPRLHFLVHGVHHDYPNDKYRLVLPPAVSIVLAAMFFGLYWLMLGPVLVFPAWSGFVFGYVVYDCTHYAIHHFRPRTTLWKRLRAHHMNHHHNRPDRKFGVSSMVWDRVFRTL